MKVQMLTYIKQNKLFFPEDKILIGVSGGMDSVTLCHLFANSGFKFGIAHCNFQLRGDESEDDHAFVEALAQKLNAPFYSVRFDTEKIAAEEKISVQMTARKLRYEWFEKTRQEESYKYIALAHHSDDDVETFFINLLRGTGIAGLAGIQNKNGRVIRPLLFAKRKEIEAFIKSEKLEHREDSSNLEQKYLRNKIRLEILPQLKSINPSIEETVKNEIGILRDINLLLKSAVEEKRKQLFFNSSHDNSVSVKIDELKKLHPLKTFVYQLFQPFNFNIETIEDLIKAFDSSSGKKFYSKTHLAIRDRELIIISPIEVAGPSNILLEENSNVINEPLKLRIQKISWDQKNKIPTSSSICCLDLQKLSFPLELRKWKEGDRFFPLGMKKSKKISDFLIDEKIPLTLKGNVYVLVSGDQIAWVVGHRIDDRFKIQPYTSDVLELRLLR
jgi:tRNA(Ile)-lysidine synthase